MHGVSFLYMATFIVPEEFEGRTLTQIRDELNAPFRPDVIGGENAPLQAGQQISFADDPGSAEFQFLQNRFKTPEQFQQGQRQAFNERLRGEEEEFLNRFREEFPEVLTGIEEELGLPGLRESAFNLQDTLRDVPDVQEQGARGFDVNANQLARMIASEQQEVAPLAQEATRQAQRAEQMFETRAQRELVPFETEIGLMKDRFAREATGFNADAESRLNVLLQKMQNEATLAQQEMVEATKLASLEETKRQFEEGLTDINLGDRVALIDRQGNEVASFAKGKLGSGSGNLESSYGQSTARLITLDEAQQGVNQSIQGIPFGRSTPQGPEIFSEFLNK